MEEKQLVEYSLNDGTTFLIEVDEPENVAIERVSLPSGQLVLKAKQTLEESLDKVKPVASVVLAKFKELSADEVEVKFGIKLTAEAGAIFTSMGGEINYEITLKWSQGKRI